MTIVSTVASYVSNDGVSSTTSSRSARQNARTQIEIRSTVFRVTCR